MTPLEVYEKLREAHALVKELLDLELSPTMLNAVDGVHAVLYMAEYVAIKEDRA